MGSLLVLAFGCGQPRSPSAPSLVKVKVGYIPIAECAHLYVGIANRYFQQEGIEIELLPMKGGAAILPAVRQGDLDIGFTNVASLIVLNAGLPRRAGNSFVSLVGASYERPGSTNHALLVRRNSKMSVKDLVRPQTKIALNTVRNIEELMLRRFLAKRGVAATRLNIVPIGFPEMLPALEKGTVDVASVVEPFIEPALRSGRFSLLAKQYQEVSPDTVVATYAVTRKWLDTHRDVGQRFVRAFQLASEFIRNNDPETRQILGSFTRIGKDDLAVIGMPAFEPTVTKAALQELIKEMRKYEFIQAEVDPEDLTWTGVASR
jgi:NitT/TauT family transport system substrate-binding protein